ncbi:unnamed protein product [Chilo suppressalis]|uniref:Caveolin n=1 Tax=Chilo suppressalis TaxID=168631 RepID=A0ABN8BE99_CHISP|nr:unnamed protein product [Chilo suppressalis]
MRKENFKTPPPHKVFTKEYSHQPTVAFEEVPIGSGGGAVLSRTTSRHCIACLHKAKLNHTEPHHPPYAPPATAPPILESPEPILEALEAVVFQPRAKERVSPPVIPTMPAAKPENMQEGLEDRDPNNLNQHVQIVWDDIIGEPEGARSPECSWRLSSVCFQYARNWCYMLLAVLIAPPCALLLGCGFACLAFEQIWCTAPCLRCVKIYFASLRTMVASCMAATVVPAAEAVGHACRHIRINWRKEAPEERDLLVI